MKTRAKAKAAPKPARARPAAASKAKKAKGKNAKAKLDVARRAAKAPARPKKKAATKKAAKKVAAKAPRPRVPEPARTQPSSGKINAAARGAAKKSPKRPAIHASKPVEPTASGRRPRESTQDDVHPSLHAHHMELAWDEGDADVHDALVARWVERGEALLRALAERGCDKCEYRADLKDGRFVWVDPDGLVAAEARARVLCSWSKSTAVVAMGWADPLVRSASVPRIDGMPPECDDATEDDAWRVAMEAAEAVKADYLYRVPAPHAWYFLALQGLTFTPSTHAFTPSTPVGLVLRSLEETRRAIESRAEPSAVVRQRLANVGGALVHEAGYTYRSTDWVARLERTGRCLITLANRFPRASFHSIAEGKNPDEWLTRDLTLDLSQAISLLEDEWAMFA